MMAVLAIGGLVGYAAASSRLDVFRNVDAGPSQQRMGEKAAGTALRPSIALQSDAVQHALVADAMRSAKTAARTCCAQGSAKAQLVAMANLNAATANLQAEGKKPNILFIMGDDVGWFNVGAYHRGIMSGKTPNLDKLASQGMLFTDYYAEASCTAGRANFITGEIPLRTGMTTVGQAGADVGLPAKACTIATALKAQGYATGQFGKNHLGRSQQVPADAAWLRRVLRLPVPPRRDVGPVLVLVPE